MVMRPPSRPPCISVAKAAARPGRRAGPTGHRGWPARTGAPCRRRKHAPACEAIARTAASKAAGACQNQSVSPCRAPPAAAARAPRPTASHAIRSRGVPSPAGGQRPGESHAWLAQKEQWRRHGDQEGVLGHVSGEQRFAQRVDRRYQRDDDAVSPSAKASTLRRHAAPQARPCPKTQHAAAIGPDGRGAAVKDERIEVPGAPQRVRLHRGGSVCRGRNGRERQEETERSLAYRHQQNGIQLPDDADGRDRIIADRDPHPESFVRQARYCRWRRPHAARRWRPRPP